MRIQTSSIVLSINEYHLEVLMSESVFKKISVTGCSSENYQKAIEAALAKIGESVHGVSWFEVKELRGGVRDGAIDWQATLEVAFKID